MRNCRSVIRISGRWFVAAHRDHAAQAMRSVVVGAEKVI
jgi:hypothetical protein